MSKGIRRWALVLTVVMLLSVLSVPAWAAEEDEDFAGLDELESSFEETVLVDNDDFTVTIEEFEPDGRYGPTFSVALQNKTDRKLTFTLDWVSLNDVLCDPFWGESVPAGKTAYDEISWYPEELAEVGVNYVDQVDGLLWVYDSEDYSADDLYYDVVSWSVTNTGTDVPPVEELTFDNGYEPMELLTGVDISVVDFATVSNPEEAYEGPVLTFRIENRTDQDVTVNMDDVSVNDVMCDPLWIEHVPAGKIAYSQCEWWPEDLEDAKIDTMEKVGFSMDVYTEHSYDTLAEFTVELDLAVPGTILSREGDEDIPVPEDSEDDGDSDSEGDGTEGYIGDTLRTAFFDLTVNDAWLCDEYEGYVPSEGNTLLAADVTIYNYTSVSVPMFDTDFQVCWGTEEDEFAVPVTTARDGYPNTGVDPVGDMLPESYSIGIHKTRQGILLFEVAQGVEDYAIAFQELYESGDEGEIYLVYFTPDVR